MNDLERKYLELKTEFIKREFLSIENNDLKRENEKLEEENNKLNVLVAAQKNKLKFFKNQESEFKKLKAEVVNLRKKKNK